MTEKPLPSRKHTRLRNFDYSSNGYYYVTVCTKGKKCIFGKLVRDNGISGNTLAINERQYYGAVMRLSEYGLIAEKQLLTLEEKYGFLTIDKYVIMPNHIHMIFILDGNTAGANSPNSGTLLSATQTFPLIGELPPPYVVGYTVCVQVADCQRMP